MPSAWPSSLPDRQQLGLTIQAQDFTIRSPVDMGEEQVRQRFDPARHVITVVVPVTFTGEEYADFMAFFEAMGGCAGTFTWEHPIDDSAVVYRFLAPPQFALVAGGSVAARRWSGLLQLETVPDEEA